MSQRKEVQAHGFVWEKELLKNVYGVPAEELQKVTYTSKMDLDSRLNLLDGCDVSIKTSCSPNAVCMADCLRIFDAVDSEKPFHMVVVCYKQDKSTNTKKIESITEVDLTRSREALFGSLTRSQIEELDKAIKAIPQKRKPTEEEHRSLYALRDSLQALSAAIHLDIKCNSQQSRLQCSFNRFQEFVQANPSLVVAKSNTNEFRGSSITSEIISPPRTFKKKPTL